MRTPESAPHMAEPVVRARGRTQPTSRRNVLLVVEDPGTIQVFQQALERGGYDVVVARDGLQALRALSRARPDLLVMDLHLRLVSAAEVVAELRRDVATSVPPVLALTGAEHQLDALDDDCRPNDWVRKPCRARDLLSRVDALMR